MTQISNRIVGHDDHGERRTFHRGGNVNGLPVPIRLLVVIPAYNEEQSVGDVVRRVRTEGPACDVLVVDDGSRDGTAEAAREAGATVVRLPYNLGIGGAVQAGFLYARDHGYDWMAQVDGDGQHDPSELTTLVTAMDRDPGLDMICGSRFVSGHREYQAPACRRLGIRLFAFVLTRLVRVPVTDPTSGFRLFNRRAIELFARDYPHDYPEVEAILLLTRHGARFTEVPVRMHQRRHGSSSITSVRSMYYVTKVSLALAATSLRQPISLADLSVLASD